MVAHDPVTGKVVEYHTRDEDGNPSPGTEATYTAYQEKDRFVGFARGGGSLGSGQEEPAYWDEDGNELSPQEYKERVDATRAEPVELSAREVKALRLDNMKEAGTLPEGSDAGRFGEVTENARKLQQGDDDGRDKRAVRTQHQHDAARQKATTDDADAKPRRARGGDSK